MSEYAGRIAIGAIVAVALVVGLAFELNSLVPNSTSTSGTPTSFTSSVSSMTSSTPTTTGWFGNEAPPSRCGGSNMTISGWRLYPTGYNISMFISTPTSPGWYYPLGSTICFYTYLQNVKNQSSSLPTSESLKVEFMNESETAVMNHANSTTTYFESSCPVPAYSGSFGANSTGWNCLVVWHTGQPYNGLLPFATIHAANFFAAVANVTMPNSTSGLHISGTFGFTTTPPASTTSSSTTTPVFSCGGRFKLLTPLQSGPISLKVTTDQGAIVNNNGTVFVTHVGTNGTSSNYCLRLQPNSSGYLQIGASDGLSPTGAYNMTIFAGFNQGPGYEGSLPPITVTTSMSARITLSVPSGALSIVTSSLGGAVASTTTTTASSVENVPR
jgi:hypothetical protein